MNKHLPDRNYISDTERTRINVEYQKFKKRKEKRQKEKLRIKNMTPEELEKHEQELK